MLAEATILLILEWGQAMYFPKVAVILFMQ